MIFGGLLNFISSGADIDIEDSCSTEGFARMEGKRSMSLECALYIQMRSLSLKSLESRMELLEDLPHDDDSEETESEDENDLAMGAVTLIARIMKDDDSVVTESV